MWVRLLERSVHIHAWMQQPQDRDSIVSLYVERNVCRDSEGTNTRPERLALTPNIR
jgi:hypothetical protein